MPIDDGVSNWAKSMRRAARRAEALAHKWKENYTESMSAEPGLQGPVPAPGSRTPTTDELQTIAREHAEKVGCFCDVLASKKDDQIVCTDVWLHYLNGEIDLDELKRQIDGYFGPESFERTKETAKQVCPL